MSELAPMGATSHLDLGVLLARIARAERDAHEGITPSQANDPCSLRATAHAASRAVESGGAVAIDAALDILAGELDALRHRLDRQQEALKILGLYASDAWSRSMARRALDGRDASLTDALPWFLYDHDLACSCRAGDGRPAGVAPAARPRA